MVVLGSMPEVLAARFKDLEQPHKANNCLQVCPDWQSTVLPKATVQRPEESVLNINKHYPSSHFYGCWCIEVERGNRFSDKIIQLAHINLEGITRPPELTVDNIQVLGTWGPRLIM